MAKNPESSLPFQRIILLVGQINNRRFEKRVSYWVRHFARIRVKHFKGQSLRIILFRGNVGDIFTCDATSALNDLLQFGSIMLDQVLAECITDLL